MVMFAIFAAVLVLMLLGVTTAVTMGFASVATFLLAGGDAARLFWCRSGCLPKSRASR